MRSLLLLALTAVYDLKPTLLPGASNFTMTIYGAPSAPADLEALIQFMKNAGMGQGLDPGPAPTRQNLAVLAKSNFTFTSVYPAADFEVPSGGGPYLWSSETLAGLNRLNEKMFVTVSFGEYGYFFHCLRENNSVGWWHAQYPNASDFAMHQHEITPNDSHGYRSKPKSHREAFVAVDAYVQERKKDYRGWMTQMLTGYGHYTEQYGARWGTKMISLEVGESILDTQSKYAFARGASRRYKLPWSAQVSPWHGNSVTTAGPLRYAGGLWSGQAAGHSTSFYRRMFIHAWFAGAAMLTPENSFSYFFDVAPKATASGTLSAHGTMAQRVHKLMATHDRGTPFIPMLVVIDEAAGYSRIPCNLDAVSWGVFTANDQAAETAHLNETEVPASILVDLFEGQIWPSEGRGIGPETIEESQLRPTPFGELIDVALSDSPGYFMSAYKVILLAGGDIDFNSSLADQLLVATHAASGPRLLLQRYHVASLRAIGKFDGLNATGRVEVLDLWINPATKKGSAISNQRLSELSEELMPFAVSANVSVQYQVNTLEPDSHDWLLEVMNNDGIAKPVNATASVDESKTSNATVTAKFSYHKVMLWGDDGDQKIAGAGASGSSIQLVLPPGAIAHLRFVVC